MTMRDWTKEDWRELYEERAAIKQFDGGMPKEKAEREAREECRDIWRRATGRQPWQQQDQNPTRR